MEDECLFSPMTVYKSVESLHWSDGITCWTILLGRLGHLPTVALSFVVDPSFAAKVKHNNQEVTTSIDSVSLP